MRAWRLYINIFLALLSLGCFLSPSASRGAQQSTYAQPAEDANVSICFIIDSSDSMKDNDPDNLRVTAAKLFISMLDSGDAVGIVSFGTQSQVVAPITTIRDKIEDARADKLNLIRALDGITYSGYTNMKAAFLDATIVLTGKNPNHRPIVVFLTDGDPNPAEGNSTQYEIDTLKAVKDLGVQVLAIGLTKQAQGPFLGRIVREAGHDSALLQPDNAAELLDSYLGILSTLKDRTIVGLGDPPIPAPGRADMRIEPGLVPYIDNVSFIAANKSRPQISFADPSGGALAPNDPRLSISITDPSFTVLTLPPPITGGVWMGQVTGGGEAQVRAILRSRLRVRVVQPGTIHPLGDPMPVIANVVLDKTRSIGDASLSALISRPDGSQDSLDQLYDDGSHGDSTAADGDFANFYNAANITGTYKIVFNGNKGGVPVSRSVQVEVVEFPRIVIDSPRETSLQVRGPITITARLVGGEPPALDQGILLATVTRPNGTSAEPITMTIGSSPGLFSAAYVPDADGAHEIKVSARDALYKATPYNREATAKVDITRLPTITISTNQVDLGRLESLADGQNATVRIISTGSQTETLGVSVAGIPGASVSPTSVQIGPRADANQTFRIVSSSDLAPRVYTGTLVFTARPEADLQRPTVSVTFEIVAASIQIAPQEIDLGNLDGIGSDTVVTVVITSTSPRTEQVKFLSITPEGVQVRPEPGEIAPNSATQVRLHLSSTQGWDAGDRQVALKFDKPRPQVAITSSDTFTVRFHVQSFLEKFGWPVGILLALIILTLILIWALQCAPGGQLVGIVAPAGQAPRTYYIKNYVSPFKSFRKRVTIGSSPKSHIRLNDPSVSPQHAVIFASRRNHTRVVGTGARQRTITARGCVTLLANASPSARTTVKEVAISPSGNPLERGQLIKIGNYEFEYR